MAKTKKFTLLFLLVCGLTNLQAASSDITGELWDWTIRNMLIVLSTLVVMGVVACIWGLFSMFITLRREEEMIRQGIPVRQPKQATDSTFSKLYRKLTALKPMEKESEIVMDHEYDGIRELDNSLPPWWLYTFYFTIAFGIGYVYVYHFSDLGLSQQEEYVQQMEEAETARIAYLARQKNMVNESNVEMLEDIADLGAGEAIYKANCAACHGIQGEGGVGPNLTDEYWLHGGGIKNVFARIKYGVPEKGMIAWKAQMKPLQMQQVASFIMNLQGTDPPNAKEPQGDPFIIANLEKDDDPGI